MNRKERKRRKERERIWDVKDLIREFERLKEKDKSMKKREKGYRTFRLSDKKI